MNTSAGSALIPWRRPALWAGAASSIASLVAGWFAPREFFAAYLSTYIFYVGVSLGCMAILMIYHLTGGTWGFVIRGILESGMGTLPLLAILFIPAALGARYLYPWAQPELVRIDDHLRAKQDYLNLPFFVARAALFFALWLGFSRVLTAWSRRQAREATGRLFYRLNRLSGVGLVVYGVTLHFAAVDWLMSLEPVFHSTIYGPVVAAGQLLSALALVLVVLARMARPSGLADVLSPKVLNDLGNLLLTLVVVWAYLAWCQYMLVWIGNLPVDVVWYLPRQQGGWRWLLAVIALLQFAIPFFLLLLRAVKRDLRTLAAVAALPLASQLMYCFYQVLPAFPPGNLASHVINFLLPIGMGGFWLAYLVTQMTRRPLLPRNDPNETRLEHRARVDRQKTLDVEALAPS